jgi:competence protein ComEA
MVMATKDDRRAALLLVGLAVAGLVVRLISGSGPLPGALLYRAAQEPRTSRDSLTDQALRLNRPLSPGETIDVDRASAQELTRLPRIGPALAGRIVTERTARGGFGSLQDLDEVPGIGPAVIEGIKQHVVFSGPARRSAKQAAAGRVRLNTATSEELEELPGIGPALARAIIEDRRRRGRFKTVDGLTRVRGIGPVTVERIRGLVVP